METKHYTRETFELQQTWQFANSSLRASWGSRDNPGRNVIEATRFQVMRDLRLVA